MKKKYDNSYHFFGGVEVQKKLFGVTAQIFFGGGASKAGLWPRLYLPLKQKKSLTILKNQKIKKIQKKSKKIQTYP